MSDDVPPLPASGDKKERKKEQKKKDKVRSAWISFVGRIVAQVMGAVATVALGLLIADRLRPSRDGGPPPSIGAPARAPARAPGSAVAIAVLPLQNLSGDARQEYFADGMTEALITDLAQMRGLRVISRTSSMVYKGQQKSLPEIARELGVDLIVEGSVARAGDRVRVSAQLIDASSDEHLWARSYDRRLRDVLVLQGEVAAAIAGEVKGALTPDQRSRLSLRRPPEPEAYDLYLRGRHAWNLRTPQGFQDALRFFEQAVQREPTFALAYAGLADTYSLLGAWSHPGDHAAKAKGAAARALELDDGLAEAHTSLAAVQHRAEGDTEAAERGFQRALSLNDGYATARQWYAILLAEDGRDAEATSHAQQAVDLDPLSGPMHMTLGLVHYYGRRYRPAIAEARRALELAPQLALARQILARALLADGQPAMAIEACEQGEKPAGPEMLALMSLGHLRRGDRARGETLFKKLAAVEPIPAAALARWHAATGDREAALRMLERARAGGPFAFQPLPADPVFDGLRSDARFAALVRRAKGL